MFSFLSPGDVFFSGKYIRDTGVEQTVEAGFITATYSF